MQAIFKKFSFFRKSPKTFVIAMACLLALSVLGCGGPDFLETYPTTGKISFNGRPMAGAKLTFYPTSQDEVLQKVMPKATVEEDGSFTVYTYKIGDGAPAGEYKMTVAWPNGSDEMCETPGYIADQLHGRFASVDQSKLQVKVEAGFNEIPEITLQ